MDRTLTRRASAPASMLFAWLLSAYCGCAAAAPPLDAYGRLPGVELVRLAPSGERVAMIGVVGEKRRLLIVTTDGKLLQASFIGDSKVRNLAWAGDEHLLVTASATVNLALDFGQTYELDSVLHVGLDGKKPWMVFEKSESISHTVRGYYGSAKREGRWTGYFGGITQARGASGYYFDHGYADLYRVDLDTGETRLEAKGAESDRDWVVSGDGRVVAHSEYNRSTGEWRLFPGAKNNDVLLKKMSPTRDIDLLGAGRRPGTVLVLDRSGNGDLLEEIDIADGRAETILGDSSVTGYIYDPVTRLLLGAETVQEPGAVFFDPKLQARINGTRKAFPGLQVHLYSASENLGKLVVKTDGGDDAGTVWLVDIASGKADPLGYEYPEIKAADVGPTRLFKYQAGDGLAIEGVLTLPPAHDGNPLPLVVLPHGGPIGVADRLGFDWWAQAMASRGYAVFQPNYRGSSGYTADFRTAGFGEWGRKMLTDISDGVAALAKEQIIDPERVCIVGASYGGYAALAGVTLQQGLYRCAVSVSGPANLQSFGAWQSARYGYATDATRYWGKVTGLDVKGEGVLREISPAAHADKADAPILLIHGKDDTRVPIEQSEQMASALKHARKTYDFVVLPNEDHFLSREVTRIAMLKAALGFVEKYNPPH